MSASSSPPPAAAPEAVRPVERLAQVRAAYAEFNRRLERAQGGPPRAAASDAVDPIDDARARAEFRRVGAELLGALQRARRGVEVERALTSALLYVQGTREYFEAADDGARQRASSALTAAAAQVAAIQARKR